MRVGRALEREALADDRPQPAGGGLGERALRVARACSSGVAAAGGTTSVTPRAAAGLRDVRPGAAREPEADHPPAAVEQPNAARRDVAADAVEHDVEPPPARSVQSGSR